MTGVEEALRAQRGVWQEIITRVQKEWVRALPPNPPKRVVFFGQGSSHFAAKLTAAILRARKGGYEPTILASQATQIQREIRVMPGDWVFAISHRAKPGVTIEALRQCERAGALTVLVASRDAEAQGIADFHLPTSGLEKVEPHTFSMTGAICAITTLLGGDGIAEEWIAQVEAVDPDLDALKSRMTRPPAVTLGEHESEWVAREAALKIMEMTGATPRAYGAEEFFHGPHFCKTSKDVIWHFDSPDDPRREQIPSTYRFARVGDGALSWLPALIEAQWSALALALNLERNPDQPAPVK